MRLVSRRCQTDGPWFMNLEPFNLAVILTLMVVFIFV